MTAEELQVIKEKIKNSMVEHLTKSIGYPDCTNDQIISQLKPMWVKLEEENLILPGMSFSAFTVHAEHAFLFQQMQGIMGL